ncbi:hypothetical protein LIER_38802 [Lithospermum erythrorhizon]|uniref:Uncharacterized protein n=1 Tax=Lithospermum erythrorhizon TaxID=34254 RepID=A0AAV3Q4W4_LITER
MSPTEKSSSPKVYEEEIMLEETVKVCNKCLDKTEFLASRTSKSAVALRENIEKVATPKRASTSDAGNKSVENNDNTARLTPKSALAFWRSIEKAATPKRTSSRDVDNKSVDKDDDAASRKTKSAVAFAENKILEKIDNQGN